MVYKGAIDQALRAYIYYSLNDKGRKPSKLSQELGVSLATIYRIKNNGLKALKVKKKKPSPGRPKKIGARTVRLIIRQIKCLREDNPNFSSGKVMEACQIQPSNVSNRTVRCVMNQNGYGYRQARKKGVLSRDDIQKRYRFAKKLKKNGLKTCGHQKLIFI